MAANGKTTATTPDTAPDTNEDLDPADQAIAANLNTRVNDERLGSNLSGVVLEAESDSTVWDHNGATALMPASNTKLATATAALTVLGPNHRFKTKVVYGDGTLTLVGGGDRTLANGPAIGTYRVDDRLEMKGAPRISRADVAAFMHEAAHRPEWSRRDAVITD